MLTFHTSNNPIYHALFFLIRRMLTMYISCFLPYVWNFAGLAKVQANSVGSGAVLLLNTNIKILCLKNSKFCACQQHYWHHLFISIFPAQILSITTRAHTLPGEVWSPTSFVRWNLSMLYARNWQEIKMLDGASKLAEMWKSRWCVTVLLKN